MKNIKLFKEFIADLNEAADGILDDVEDDNSMFDIDIDLEDDKGKSLDDDPEETGDYSDEKSRPPKLTKRQRKANQVKAKVSREMLGKESKLRPVINKIFLKIEKEIKKEARQEGVPVNQINLDKLTIRR